MHSYNNIPIRCKQNLQAAASLPYNTRNSCNFRESLFNFQEATELPTIPMAEKSLNNCSLLHVHKELMDDINLVDFATDFLLVPTSE